MAKVYHKCETLFRRLQRLTVDYGHQSIIFFILKKMVTCFLLAATLTTFSCKKENQPKDHNVHIDLQGWFDNHQVSIFIDGKQTFSGTATTNITLGWAGSTSSTLP